MKKRADILTEIGHGILTITVVSFILFFVSTPLYAQNIERGELALFLFNDIYPNGTNPTDFEAGYFPTPYLDEGQAGSYEDFIRILSFLELGDGVPVFDRVGTSFRSDEDVPRVEVIKMVIEAYDIPLNISGSLPYNDYNDPNDPYYNQVLTAYNYGIISGGSYLYPYDYAIVNFATALMNSAGNISVPAYSELYDTDSYFKPFNVSLETMGQFQGMEQGGFSHYAKNSFVIPDIKFNLDFSHFYSNMMVEMPPEFYPIKPLGRGWSHTYNSYIVFENNPGGSSDDFYTIVWPDGTIHIYNKDDNEYETKGVYDDLYELGNGNIRVTKKDQTRYYYEQFDNGRPIYYLYRIRDRNGNEINIEYQNAEENDTRRIEWVEAPSGKKLFFDYQNNTDLIYKITDPIGREIVFEYVISSNSVYQYPVLVVFEDAKDQFTHYSYGINNPYDIHLLNRIELPEGNEILAEYSGDGKLSEYQINNDDPTEVEINFDYSNQDYESTVDVPTEGGNINTQDYTFNEYGSITDYIDNNNSLQINYPSGGVNVLLPINSNMNGVDIDYDYDPNGNIIEIDKENGMSVEEFDWNSDNTLDDYTDANGNTTYFYYDNDGNLEQIKDALDNWSYFTYDNYGQLETATNQEWIQTVYTYENDGAISTINMPESISHSFLHDGINRLTQRNDNGLITSYVYDENDNLTSQTNSGNFTTTFDYDMNDNLTEIVNANFVSTEFEYDDEDRVIKETFGNLEKEYEYGDEGFLEEYTKPSTIQIDYEYDNDGRLEETGTISDIDYNSRNLIEDITTNAGTTYLDYNSLNRLDEVTTVHGSYLEYVYDDVGNVTRIIYPTVNGDNVFAKYYYDEKNRLKKVRISINSQYTTIAEYLYRDDDLISDVYYGNGVHSDYFYDNAGRKTGIAHILGTTSGSVLFSENVILDNRNNIISETRYYLETPNPDFPYSGTSDPHNYTYDDNNHLLSIDGVTHDVNADGNTTQRPDQYNNPGQPFAYEFEYDVDDMVTEIDRTDSSYTYPLSFTYNGFGLQVSKSRETGFTGTYIEYFTRDLLSGNTIFESNNFGNEVIYHVYGATGLEFTINHAGEFIYHLSDLKGSVIAEVGEDLTDPIKLYHYDDFGQEIQKGVGGSNTGGLPRPNKYRYLGKHGIVRELGTPFYNVKARYYDPQVGRFLSEDPIWSTNLYPYSDNNPISKIDPDGKESVNVFIQIGKPGHVFIEVNDVIFSYGRYGELGKPKLGGASPTGQGILKKYAGDEKIEMLKYESFMYSVEVQSAQDIYLFFDAMYSNGKSTEIPYGRHIDSYNLFSNNCTTKVIDGLNAGGGEFHSSIFIPLQLLSRLIFSPLW